MAFQKIFKTSVIGLSLMAFSTFSGAQAADDDHGGDHSYNVSTIGIFLGGTSVSSETNFTFGGEYEYRFNEMFGAGVIFEHTSKAHNGDGTSIYMAQLHAHPYKMLRLSAGFGKEKIHHEGAHSENVYRLGAAYDFHVGGFGLAPTVNVDFVGGHEAVVFGIALTKGF